MRPSRFLRKQDSYARLNRDEELERAQAENRELKEQLVRYQTQIKAANEQLMQLKQRYSTLINELSMREKAAEEISRLALKEANQVIETAKGNADLIVREAMTSAKTVFIEISRVSKETSFMRSDIKDKLLSMNQMLDSFKIPTIPNLDYLAKDDKSEEHK